MIWSLSAGLWPCRQVTRRCVRLFEKHMLNAIIAFSLKNRGFVLIAAIAVLAGGRLVRLLRHKAPE